MSMNLASELNARIEPRGMLLLEDLEVFWWAPVEYCG